ncbi:protein kinase family protein [Candidatus Uhrbacteria bacterium]|nr:protein kinase family protein [Candidatus Uhrbacteria bacterium]
MVPPPPPLESSEVTRPPVGDWASEAVVEATPPAPADRLREERRTMGDEAWVQRVLQEFGQTVEAPEGYQFNASLQDELATMPPEGMKHARGLDAPPPPLETESMTPTIPERVYSNGLLWEVGKMVGRGGFGRVYEVTHAGSSAPRKRLVKFMYVLNDQRLRGHLWNEVGAAMLAGDFVGSEVIQDEQGGTWAALVLERHAGENVERYISERQRTVEGTEDRFDADPRSAFRMAVMLRTVLHTLRRMHSVGWIHRDVKPGNTILSAQEGEEWLARLIDFGTAAKEGLLRTQTGSRSFIGTIAYAPPETLTEIDVDLRVRDYWGAMVTAAIALGIVVRDQEKDFMKVISLLEEGRYLHAQDLDDPRVEQAFVSKHSLTSEHMAFVKWIYRFLRPRDNLFQRKAYWQRTGITKSVEVKKPEPEETGTEWDLENRGAPGMSVAMLDDDKFVRELEDHIRALGAQIGRDDVEEHLSLLQEFSAP